LITPLIVKHFAHWGFEVHVGSSGIDSKSGVLFYTKDHKYFINPTDYDGTNLSPNNWEGGFYIAVADKFKYLGSYLTRNGRDEYDVDSRITFAGTAFYVSAFSLLATFQHWLNVQSIYQLFYLSFYMEVNHGL